MREAKRNETRERSDRRRTQDVAKATQRERGTSVLCVRVATSEARSGTRKAVINVAQIERSERSANY